MPVYNDWEAVSRLLCQLDQHLSDANQAASVLVVDDGSTIPSRSELVVGAPMSLSSVKVLRLRRNVGHQRAIAAGIVHVFLTMPNHDVVVMDADGEDRPQDLPCLLAEAQRYNSVVFAQRTKRLESVGFQLGYFAYRLLHRFLTGVSVRFGNFSVVPHTALSRLVLAPELWNHYSAAVVRSRLPYRMLPLPRGERLAGRSKMNYVSLFMHGLSAISVFADVAAARVVAATAFLLLLDIAAIAGVMGVRIFTQAAIPGWASYSVGILTVLLVQLLSLSFVLIFLLLNLRSHAVFVPLRDGRDLIETVEDAL